MSNATIASAGASDAALPPEQVVFGITRAMYELRETVNLLAQSEVPLLIRGEMGTGKKVLAQLIHDKSLRSEGPFVQVTCSAIAGTPLEEELFGRAGTGSEIMRRAAGGTLFLDEIGDLDQSSQTRLLQLFRERQYTTAPRQEDARIGTRLVCATRRNLEDAMESGAFRSDLFYRIHVASIDVPPLRERREDIPILVDYFLERYRKQFQSAVPPLSQPTLRRLEEFSWPGNIRELENMIKRYVILGSEGAMCDGLAEPVARALSQAHSGGGRLSLKRITRQASRDLERQIILQVLAENRGNRRQTAKVLNISYRALLYKLKEAVVAGVRIPGRYNKQ